jgi:ribosomal protein S18 acetylase RimI-like enzyme
MPYLKTATIEEIPDILNMMEDFNSIDNYPFNREYCKGNLIEFLDKEELGKLWLIYHEKNIVGYLVLTFGFSFEYKGRDAFIDELYLKTGFRNQGIGSKIFDKLIPLTKELGLNAIHLEVEKENEAGNKLYSKNGFERSNRTLLTRILNK